MTSMSNLNNRPRISMFFPRKFIINYNKTQHYFYEDKDYQFVVQVN